MLQQVCEEILNYFAEPKDAVPGEFTISGNSLLPVLDLVDGQRIWIHGSACNDGVYTYHAGTLYNDDDTAAAQCTDETFDGAVWPMKIPASFMTLAKEISDWNTKYGEVMNSPYTSESVIGVYNYTKRSGDSDDSGNCASWQSVFASRLKRWRRFAL